MENKKREPLIHITKRSSVSWGKAWLVRIASIVAAVIVCAVITTLFTGDDPIRVFMSIIDGAFGSEKDMDYIAKSVDSPYHILGFDTGI